MNVLENELFRAASVLAIKLLGEKDAAEGGDGLSGREPQGGRMALSK